MTLFLLDASVLITAKDNYYPMNVVPEFWEWIAFRAGRGEVKIPFEVFDEIKDGPSDKTKDPLYAWIQQPEIKNVLVLKEEVDTGLLQRVVFEGYANDLTDEEIEQLGRDPFLVAYALAAKDRCVVTSESSKPSKRRHNRHVPDVCDSLGQPWCGPFELNKRLAFSTNWKKLLPSANEQ